MPDGEEWTGTHQLPSAFNDRRIDARWVAWDDPEVDWKAADLVAVRSTWDYDSRREEFLAWARSVGPALLNGAEVFAWNTDKSYLLDLAAAGVPVVPTFIAEDRAELDAALDVLPIAVVKPAVGAGGRGVALLTSQKDEAPQPGPPWVVQPLVDSVRTRGELSVFVLGGLPVSQAVKRPAAGEIRVHEQYGGVTRPMALNPVAGDLAVRAVEAAERRLGVPLSYARVDLMWLGEEELVVSELEATEPGLYLDVLPQNADAFADLVVDILGH